MTTTAKKVTGFEWNKETETQATELYLALIEAQGLEVANTNDALGSVAKEVGAKSAQAIRSKLSALKVYQKAAQARKVGGKVKTQKVHYVRAISKTAEKLGIDVTGRKFESLESAVASDLQMLVSVIEAATGESIVVNPEQPSEAATPKQITAKA